jgi:hypothetical protein
MRMIDGCARVSESFLGDWTFVHGCGLAILSSSPARAFDDVMML